ncbi:MAG: alanine racemase [Thermomicrobiales bacterium]|nr:alanine racemase [Thermomicrobiales bacterium]
MFLNRLQSDNPALLDAAVELHQSGQIPANTWLFDLDTIAANARIQAAEAKRLGLTTFLMTKQIARNPLVAATALANGIDKTVAVDMTCAHLLNRCGLPVGHIGQINQIPRHQITHALTMQPDYITVYSVEKARQISDAMDSVVRVAGARQSLLVRVYGDDDVAFAGQEGGFHESAVVDAVRAIAALPHVEVIGTTAFPVVEYTFDRERMPPGLLPNMTTITDAAKRIETELGIPMTVINAPGNTSAETFATLKGAGATHVEPGHGICGTTISQMMLGSSLERPAYTWVTEVSHIYKGTAYAFGGGLWSLMTGLYDDAWPKQMIVGSDPASARSTVLDYQHIDQIIDYHLPIAQGDRCQIGDTVVFPIYTQAQMTRSYTAAVSGIQAGRPVVEGVFDHAGTQLDEQFAPLLSHR